MLVLGLSRAEQKMPGAAAQQSDAEHQARHLMRQLAWERQHRAAKVAVEAKKESIRLSSHKQRRRRPKACLKCGGDGVFYYSGHHSNFIDHVAGDARLH